MARKMMYCGLNSMTNLTLAPTTCMMTHKQIQQMFMKRMYDEFLGFELILLILVGLMRVRLQVGLLILKTDASYTRVYTVSDKK